MIAFRFQAYISILTLAFFMAELLIFPDDDFPPEYRCQVLAFLRVQWPEGFLGENRLRNWITRPAYHPVHFILAEAGLVISHAEVVWKHLEHAGDIYKTYGLTGVFTFPSFRGQGYGLQVITAATGYIRSRSDADVGMFHCAPDLKRFYMKAGWIPMESTITYIGPRQNPVEARELRMMQFFSEKGRFGREAFERLPVFFDEDDTW